MKNNYFPELSPHEKWRQIPLWVRFCLWFIPVRIGCDPASPTSYIRYKIFKQKMYIFDGE